MAGSSAVRTSMWPPMKKPARFIIVVILWNAKYIAVKYKTSSLPAEVGCFLRVCIDALAVTICSRKYNQWSMMESSWLSQIVTDWLRHCELVLKCVFPSLPLLEFFVAPPGERRGILCNLVCKYIFDIYRWYIWARHIVLCGFCSDILFSCLISTFSAPLNCKAHSFLKAAALQEV